MFAASFKSETRKIFTLKTWWILGLVMFLLTALSAGTYGLLAMLSDQIPELAMIPIDALTIYGSITSAGYVIPLLSGALATTNEYRHRTLTPTFLAIPKRGIVFSAKLLTQLLLGIFYGLLGLVAAVGLGAPLLVAAGYDTALSDPSTWWLFLRIIAALAIWGAIGVGLGALVKNQTVAIVIALVFTQFVEPIIRTIGAALDWVREAVEYLPGAATDAFVGASAYSSLGEAAATGLEWWIGGLVLLTYTALVCALGSQISWKKDVS